MKPKHAIFYINLSLLFLSFGLVLMSVLNSPYILNIGLGIGIAFSILLLWNFSFYKKISNNEDELTLIQSEFNNDVNDDSISKTQIHPKALFSDLKKIDHNIPFKDKLELKVKGIANEIGLVAGLAYQLEGECLNLVYLYALEEENHKSKILLGDGITGEVCRTGTPVTLNISDEEIDEKDLPVIDVFSGLGQARPKYLHVLPVYEKVNVIGVVELASFSEVEKDMIDLLIEVLKS